VQTTSALNVADFTPNSAEPLYVGAHGPTSSTFIGDISSIVIGAFGDVFFAVRMEANDAPFTNGLIPDGSTFTSNGRVWTVHGTDVSYTGEIPEFSGSFELEGVSDLAFTGTEIQNLEGSFALEGASDLAFTGIDIMRATFALEGEADTEFVGVELLPLSGSFTLLGESFLDFTGESFFTGSFGLESEALLGFSGLNYVDREFALVGSAELGFTGQAEMHGLFGLEGTADVSMIWMPLLCPGTSAVGCGVRPSSVTDRLYPASACLCGRKDC